MALRTLKTLDRRLQRLEAVAARKRSQGPSLAELLRERIRRRCVAEGKPPPQFSSAPLHREGAKPLIISDVLRQRFSARREESL